MFSKIFSFEHITQQELLVSILTPLQTLQLIYTSFILGNEESIIFCVTEIHDIHREGVFDHPLFITKR